MLKRFLARLLSSRPLQTLSSLDAYAQWAATYPPRAHNALMEAEQAAMLSLMPDLAGRAVLDLACGTGRYGLIARERDARTVIGLDNSPAMLRAHPLKLIALSSSEAIPLAGESVDVVLCGLALGHLPRLEPAMREISRILKPGGCALISDFHPFLFLSGRRRTFTALDGKTYAIEHYPHLYADYHRAARQAGMGIEQVTEPRLGQNTSARFSQNVGEQTPIVIVYRMRKVI